MTLNPPEQYLAYNLTVADLHLGIVPSESATNDVAAQRVTSCFTILQGQGYTLKDSQYNKQQHIDILGYNMASIHFNIPTVIYLSMPNTTFMPEKVAANVQGWREMNPNHTIELYDDQRIEALVESYLEIPVTVWRLLMPAQRTDIWRYLVVYLFGGWYFDSDVQPMRPMLQWGHSTRNTFVIGVEAQSVVGNPGEVAEGTLPVVLAQYAFGAAARLPVLKELLNKAVANLDAVAALSDQDISPEERLKGVLESTGPILWTESVVKFLCYSDDAAYLDASNHGVSLLSATNLATGGSIANTHIFPIAGFGAGQRHSNSPTTDSAGVNAWHHFGASVWFHGKTWPHLTHLSFAHIIILHNVQL